MRNSLLIIIFVIVFQVSAFAQSTPNDFKTSDCITGTTVTISPELMQIGETSTATLTFDQSERSDLTFDWTISGGTILEGQGTRTIKVTQRNENAGQALTVTVSVGGLPEICQRYVSATQSIAIVVGCGLVDEFDEYSNRKFEKAEVLLDNFAAQIMIDKTKIGLVLFTFDSPTSRAKLNSRIKKVFSYLKGVRKIESNHLKFALSFNEREKTQLFILPRNSDFVPYDSKIVSDEDLAEIISPQNPKRRKSR